MHMIGEDNPGVDAAGRTGAHPANRVAQYVDFASPTDPNGVAQVHCKEACRFTVKKEVPPGTGLRR
jgi:hypothetical protein